MKPSKVEVQPGRGLRVRAREVLGRYLRGIEGLSGPERTLLRCEGGKTCVELPNAGGAYWAGQGHRRWYRGPRPIPGTCPSHPGRANCGLDRCVLILFFAACVEIPALSFPLGTGTRHSSQTPLHVSGILVPAFSSVLNNGRQPEHLS